MGWVDAIQNRYQYYSDKLKSQFRYRWIATCVLACFYAIRAYLNRCLVITLFLASILTLFFIHLLTSIIERDNPDRVSPPVSSYAPLILPIKASDELRPFHPLLTEFEFWGGVNVVLCVALGVTFLSNELIFPEPIFTEWFWPFIFFGIWLIMTIYMLIEQRRIMIKYKYIPFYYGDKKRGEYKGK